MKIKELGRHQQLLTTNHGEQILYSYEKAVAGYSPKIGYFKSNASYPLETLMHIDSFIKEPVVVISPTEIEYLIGTGEQL